MIEKLIAIFFSPKDKNTACGVWTPTYVVAVAVVMASLIILIYLSRNMKKEMVERVIRGMAIFASVTEIIKMVFKGITYGVEKVDLVPLYFCSLFIYMTILASMKNQTLKNAGLSFLFFGGIFGALAFFAYPNSCIPNYPIYHFMCLRTMLYHGSMIYTGILIVMTGYYQPKLSDFKPYAISLSIVCALAYTVNLMTGNDYMYLMKPLKIGISETVYNAMPHVYPFIVMLIQIFVPFAATFIAYSIYVCIYRIVKSKSI